jgi:hypothetical protein
MMFTVTLAHYYIHLSPKGSSLKCNLQSLHSDSTTIVTLFRKLLQSQQSHDLTMIFALLILLPAI